MNIEREYLSYYHIGLDCGVSESTVCRTLHKIENILIRSRKFSLPGKKRGASHFGKSITQSKDRPRVSAPLKTAKVQKWDAPKKSLLNSELDPNLIVMDVMENPIERPSKHQKIFYSGKHS